MNIKVFAVIVTQQNVIICHFISLSLIVSTFIIFNSSIHLRLYHEIDYNDICLLWFYVTGILSNNKNIVR